MDNDFDNCILSMLYTVQVTENVFFHTQWHGFPHMLARISWEALKNLYVNIEKVIATYHPIH